MLDIALYYACCGHVEQCYQAPARGGGGPGGGD